MKTLYLLRHAKSTRKHGDLKDFARPLNSNGVKEIIEVSAFAKARKVKPDLLLCSPSIRTYSTAVIFCTQLGLDSDKLILNPELYDCTAQQILNVLQNVQNKNKSVLVTGHNPSMSDVLHRLTNEAYTEMDTGTLVSVSFEIDSWKEITKVKGKINYSIVPGRHLNKI